MPPPDETDNLIAEHKQMRDRYGVVFGSPEGELVLAHIQTENHVMERSHFHGDPYQTAFLDGERSAVLKIIAMIQPFDEEAYKRQLEELTAHDPLADVSHQPQE